MDVCVTVKDNIINIIDNAENIGVLVGVDLMLDAMKVWFESENYAYKYLELKNRCQLAANRFKI